MFSIGPSDDESSSKTPTPTPPAPRQCKKCKETRPPEAFIRSWKPHMTLMGRWKECNRCVWTQKEMTELEFNDLYRNPETDLVIHSNLTVRFSKCPECARELPSRAFIRGLCPTVPATSKKAVCNECCLRSGDMTEESEVEYPKRPEDKSGEARECLACYRKRSAEYYIRSNTPHGPVISDWRSCNHCAMRRSKLSSAVFASRFHGKPAEKVN